MSNQRVDWSALLLIYYSAGLTVSRVGSLVLEPLLKRVGMVRFGEYQKYLFACEKDKKIEVLVEQSYSYRTIAGGIFCLILAWPIQWVVEQLALSGTTRTIHC